MVIHAWGLLQQTDHGTAHAQCAPSLSARRHPTQQRCGLPALGQQQLHTQTDYHQERAGHQGKQTRPCFISITNSCRRPGTVLPGPFSFPIQCR